MKIFMICALALIAGCNTHTPSRDLSPEEIVERYKYIDVVRVKAIGNTGCDLYIVTTLNLDKVVVCPTNQSPPVLTQENSPENFHEFKLKMNLFH